MSILRIEDWDDEVDESVLLIGEEIVALQQLMLAALSRIAARAENPFDELQTIRRLALAENDLFCRVSDHKVRPERVADETDRFIRLAETRLI